LTRRLIINYVQITLRLKAIAVAGTIALINYAYPEMAPLQHELRIVTVCLTKTQSHSNALTQHVNEDIMRKALVFVTCSQVTMDMCPG